MSIDIERDRATAAMEVQRMDDPLMPNTSIIPVIAFVAASVAILVAVWTLVRRNLSSRKDRDQV